jgi:hypothetical protein
VRSSLRIEIKAGLLPDLYACLLHPFGMTNCSAPFRIQADIPHSTMAFKALFVVRDFETGHGRIFSIIVSMAIRAGHKILYNGTGEDRRAHAVAAFA